MRYSKPQVLTSTKATAAIQNAGKPPALTQDGQFTTNPGYEDNE